MTIPDELHRARALANIGLQDGLPKWAYALEVQRSRLRELQAEARRLDEIWHSMPTGELASLTWKQICEWNARLAIDSHFLLVAVRHVLQLARHLRDRTRDNNHRAEALLEAFLRGKHGRAEMVRGILEHFDRYWIEGKQDPRKGMGEWPRPVEVLHEDDKLYLRVGPNQVDLLLLADDALELAHKLYEVWSEVRPWDDPYWDPRDPPDDLDELGVRIVLEIDHEAG
jgi:hypothetical protein